MIARGMLPVVVRMRSRATLGEINPTRYRSVQVRGVTALKVA
jgi:hypothetical protein